MTATAPHWDADLQMEIEAPHVVDLHHVEFLRWLAERGRLEHAVAGPSSGALAVCAVIEQLR